MQLTAQKGVDVILEMLANVNLGKDLTVLSKRGRIAVIGCRGTVEIDPRQAMSREATIVGVLLSNASDQEKASIHAALFAALENRTLRPVVGQELFLAEAPRASGRDGTRSAREIVLIP